MIGALLLLLGMSWAGPPVAAPAEVVPVVSADGGFAVLHHLENIGGPAVILIHGISSNHRFWDLEPDRSLARALHQAGFDVWNMDLRGHGDALRLPDGKRPKADWSVDDYGEQDLPAAIGLVRAKTGLKKVSVVGHSMGGMVLAVYLATFGDEQLKSAVVVASPLDFRDPDWMLSAVFHASPLVKGLGFVPTPAAAKMFTVAKRELPLQLDALLHNPENFERTAEGRMFRTVVSPMSRGEIAQFSTLAEDGEFRSVDGSVRYREALGGVRMPMFFVAGRADRVVSPERVRAYYNAVPNADRSWVVISKANGFTGDYGHLDYGCADGAKDDVFPQIINFLKEHP